jgi:mono/diheme cytochrome c family protein
MRPALALVALGVSACTTAGGGADDTTTGATDTDGPTDTDGTTSPTGERADAILALDGDIAAGSVLYGNTCVLCHGPDGKGGIGEFSGADLTATDRDPRGIVLVLLLGIPETRMASYAAWPDQDLADVHAYVEDAFVPP